MSKLLLLDGYFLLHRANVKFGKEEPDKVAYNLVFNFFRSLRVLVEQFEPEKVFFCNEGANNFRYQLYSEYKANRIVKTASSTKTIEAKKELDRQRDIVFDLLPCLPITQVVADHYEADDVIGTLVDDLKDEEITIVSRDSDFIQLLQRGYRSIQLYDPIGKKFEEAPKHHYVAFKSLKGDTSDNIPGIVSEEKALQLVNDPSALKELLKNPEIQANFSLNKELIEIRTVPDEELIFTDYSLDFDRLHREFEKMEFNNILTDKYWSRFKETFETLT